MATTKPTATKSGAAEAILAALESHPNKTATDLADIAGVGHSTASKALALLEGQGKARRTPGGREQGRRLPDRWASSGEPEGPTTGPERTSPSSEVRLAKGALRAMVLEHLRQHPGEELTPSAVAKALGHSGGAVANALVRLAGDGDVAEVSASPRRYAVRA